jgi:ABC-type nitrate/sulfonate/bicarbonate transport system substrate-binding protein
MKNPLGVVLSAFLLLNGGDAFSASAPVKVVIAYAAMNARLIPLWAAEEKGFFNKYGVDAQLVFVRGRPLSTLRWCPAIFRWVIQVAQPYWELPWEERI